MKNIQEIIDITCTIYSIEDMANSFEIRSLLDHFSEVKDYFRKYNYSNPYTIDTIVDYFIVDKICQWDFSDRLKPEVVKSYAEIKDFFDTIKVKFEIKRIVNFLKGFSFVVDDTIDVRLLQRMYDLLPQYSTSINDESVFKKAIEAHPYLVLDRFKEFEKTFRRFHALYYSLFSESNIKVFLDCRLEEFAKIASKICNSDSMDSALKEMLIQQFVDCADAIVVNTDTKNALHNQIKYKVILNFLKAVSYSRYPEYLEKQKQVDGLSYKWLEANGHSFSYDLKLNGLMQKYDDKTIPWEIKYINLTHFSSQGQWQHFCKSAIKGAKKSLTDLLACANIDTNAHFSAMTQQMISFSHQVHGFAMQYFIRDPEKWSHFCQYTYSFLASVFDKISVPVDTIKDEFTAWGMCGGEYLFDKDVPDWKKKDTAYTFTDKTVKLTERVLRTVYSEEMKRNKKYFDPDKTVLGGILRSKDKDNPMIEILSPELMQYLSFCLIKDEDDEGKQVGINLRNLLEHDRYNFSDFDTGYGLLALLVFVSVVNGLFIHYQ